MSAVTCPLCGAASPAGAQFCEACGADLPVSAATPAPLVDDGPDGATAGLTAGLTAGSPAADGPPLADPTAGSAPDPAAAAESPLDVGWTGVIPGKVSIYEQPVAPGCRQCGAGNFVDGYCDHCGAKEPNPRDHLEESPADWVAGVCDRGQRHTRNEDGMSLSADPQPGTRATLVVCDGVSHTTDSDVASLAAARAARAVLDRPLGTGIGVRESMVAAATQRLGEAAAAANAAVVATSTITGDPTPPSCTFAAALITGRTAIVGNVGDSRSYWLPDGTSGAEQLSRDDSFAADQIAAGIERKVAETGPMAHSITRWFGTDAPHDLTPHTRALDLTGAGWLMVCSDGLWNYCSEAADLQELVGRFVAQGHTSAAALAGALVGFANEAGGVDNITVALARVEA